jgi:hypothetical protein
VKACAGTGACASSSKRERRSDDHDHDQAAATARAAAAAVRVPMCVPSWRGCDCEPSVELLVKTHFRHTRTVTGANTGGGSL